MRLMLAVHCFFPRHFYGTETYTLELARGLIDRGHRVTVLTAVFPGDPPQREEVERYEHQGVPVISVDKNRLPNRRVADTYHQPEHGRLLRRILAEERPELLHVTHLINHTAALLEAAAAERIPAMATFTDFFGFCYNNKLEGADGRHCAGPSRSRTNCLACHLRLTGLRQPRLAAPALRALTRLPGAAPARMSELVSDIERRPDVLRELYRHYRVAITPSAFLREAYLANGCPAPLRDVRFGVSIDRSPKPPAPPRSPLRVGFVGQIARHKGPDLLVEAVRACPPGSVDCRIYGPHEQEPSFMEALRSRARGWPVSFPGTFPKEEMARVLAGLDLLVIPSRWYENSPLVLLNALATHTPVVVTDVRGLTEFITPGESGFTFPLGDGASLSRLLRELAGTPERVRAMSAATAYPRTVEDMVADTEALQLQVLREARRRPG